MKETGFKDSRRKDIYLYDLVMVNYVKPGWIFEGQENEIFIGWDVVGPSCEDCSSLKSILDDKFSNIVVIGQQK